MKIWYQSYVDYENGASYWDALRLHLDEIVSPGTQIDIKGITPFDSYAHPLVEFRCAREMIANKLEPAIEDFIKLQVADSIEEVVCCKGDCHG